MKSTKRTDEDFSTYKDDSYHLKETILSRIPYLGLVTNITLDYMHVVCLGLTKKILLIWFSGKKKKMISIHQKEVISHEVHVSISTNTPVEFNRKISDLANVAHMKATEYRQILLYWGVVIFKHFLDAIYYNHFVTLHVAIRMLSCSHFCIIPEYVDYAEQLLIHFGESFGELYGKEYMSHNVHAVTHLAEDVRNFGPLDSFSAFKYENFMQTLKSFVRKPDRPLQQILKRYEESAGLDDNQLSVTPSFQVKYGHNNGPLPSGIDLAKWKQYERVLCTGYLLNVKNMADRCIMLEDETVAVISNILHNGLDVKVVGKKFQKKEDLYLLPCPSSKLGIFKVNNLSKGLEIWALNDGVKKCFKIPHGPNELAIFPLLHSES